ncbi:hypothetical protein FE257_012776 [Aspergillus nanangensis]|uniref:FAD/NAD(P)-binding domain-containing protein n=1 Tax=Aspergillus nanangensis TaxID=2582783 RepID=A0AAD4CFM0_ASPNN|nr:hypothetical protein FE257_012776 [Aspergillus nanangensis]
MPSLEERPPFKVLVVGGSYAGLAATLNLLDLCHGRKNRFNLDPAVTASGKKLPVEITIVDERDGYFHIIGVPLAVAAQKHAESFWTRYEDIPALQCPEVSWTQGQVETVDCESRTATIRGTGKDEGTTSQLSYDYLIAASGLKREWPSAPKSLIREEYLAETRESVATIENASEGVVVIGGGAVGIEIAAEIKMLHPQTKVSLVHSRTKLLSSEALPDEFSAKTLELLQHSNVELVLGARVHETTPTKTPSGATTYTLTLADGRSLTASHVINAVSRFHPTSSYLPAAAVDEEGYVRIHPTLDFAGEVPNAEFHYCAGDLVKWSGIKRGGAAMHQGHFAAVNIHQKMMAEVYGTEKKFSELVEVAPMMALALGETAVGYFPGTGLSEGEEVRNMFFNDDLGFTICWNWMRLGEQTA